MVGGRTVTGSVYFQGRNASDTAADIAFNPVGGSVGIGTDSPTAALSVQPTQGSNTTINFVAGSTTSDAVRLQATGNTNSWFEYDAYLGHAFKVQGNTILAFDSTGSMAIGGAIGSDYDASANTLSIKGTGDSGLTIDSGSTSKSTVAFTDRQDGVNEGWITYYHTSDSLRIGANSADRLTIDSDGFVGIGTTSSSSYDSTARQLVVQDDGNSGITIASSNTSSGTLAFADGTSGTQKYAGYIKYDHAENELKFATDGVVNTVIDSDGKVGIGVTNPNTTLDVVGGVTNTSGTLDTNEQLRISVNQFNGTGGYFSFGTTDSGVSALAINCFQGNLARDIILNDRGRNVGVGLDNPGYPLTVDFEMMTPEQFVLLVEILTTEVPYNLALPIKAISEVLFKPITPTSKSLAW